MQEPRKLELKARGLVVIWETRTQDLVLAEALASEYKFVS